MILICFYSEPEEAQYHTCILSFEKERNVSSSLKVFFDDSWSGKWQWQSVKPLVHYSRGKGADGGMK